MVSDQMQGAGESAKQHAEAIRGLLFCKHQIRHLLREAASATIKRKALESRGVVMAHDGMQSLTERINGLRECIFWLVTRYDKTTIKPCLHERAQLLGVSHRALMNHRLAIAEAIGQSLDESLLSDVIQHGETAGERERGSIWECTARDYPLFDACSINLILNVRMPDDWFESIQSEMKTSARERKRAHLRVV